MSLDVDTEVHFSIFNFKFWTRINQLRSRITQLWARSTLIVVLITKIQGLEYHFLTQQWALLSKY